MFNIGCHLSVSKGFFNMGKDALSIGANTFQCFMRNPRGGSAKALDPADVLALKQLMDENGFAPIVVHAPYTLNACAKDERLRKFAYETILDDLKRMTLLPGNLYNFHPGSHVGQGIDAGIGLIIELLNRVLESEPEPMLLLETMSGGGSEVGGRFEELKAILDGCGNHPKTGVCLDTCHVWSAGYDIVNRLDDVLEEFDSIIGLNRLHAIHLNDSLIPFGSHKDRHARIGEGTIGIEAIARLINHPKLKELPFCLETPNELPGHAEEIALLKSLYQN